MRLFARVLAVLAVFLLAAPRSSHACVHAPATATTPITQKGQRLLVLHDGKKQTTVLRVDYDAGAALEQLALVVPVPSVPSAFATGNPKLFDALDDWAPMIRNVPRSASAKSADAKGAAPAAPPTLQLFEPVETGPYVIQPIKARGSAGAEALVEWLKDNGFAPIPAAALVYYIDNHWAFLAVKAKPEQALAQSGALPPLSYTFETDRVVVPLKLEAQGTFPVRIYAVTKETLADAAFADATAKGFEVAATPDRPHITAPGAPMGRLSIPVGSFAPGTAPAELKATLQTAGMSSAAKLEMRLLVAERFGSGAADPSTWKAELALPALDSGAPAKGEAKDAAKPDPSASATKTKSGKKPVGKKAPASSKKDGDSGKSGLCAVGNDADSPAALVLMLALAAWRRRRRAA